MHCYFCLAPAEDNPCYLQHERSINMHGAFKPMDKEGTGGHKNGPRPTKQKTEQKQTVASKHSILTKTIPVMFFLALILFCTLKKI